MRFLRSSVFLKTLVAISGLMIAAANPLLADDGSTAELLKPTGGKTATSQPTHKITYKLSNGSDNWNADARAKIVKAMDEAVAVYNKYGDFDRVLTANWNPGTPTADANFGGWINFGGQIGTRTALHEIAHTLGIGTCPKWGQFARDGKWTGKYGIAQLQQLDGPGAVLHCDRQHFWPYGLNYDNEGGKENFRRNVLMVTAMRADMGLGPPPHPAADALKIARADDDAAHADLEKAVSALNVLSNQLQARLTSRPEVVQAQKQCNDAKRVYDLAEQKALTVFRSSSDGRAAVIAADQAQKKLDALRSDPNAKSEDVTAAAQNALSSKTALAQMQSKAMESDPQIADARSKYIAASVELDAVRASSLKDNPDMVKAKQMLATARAHASAADQALAVALKAADKESSGR
jgi:hypothetical protein